MTRVDLVTLVLYVLAVVGLGVGFRRRSGTTSEFMAAGGALSGWVVGLSIFGTYLSSNTFLGVPGKAYGSNWNSFVFSLSLPLAATIAVRFFVPFYRRSGEISAYHHLERRFGRWARTYGMLCYLLTQLARMGSIMFGVALALSALTGWSVAGIIVATGVLVTLYTLLGGIEAVIWTDVVQSAVLVVGAVVILGLLLTGMTEGPGQALEVGWAEGKLSLGSFRPDLTSSTFWVVLLYGLFINLSNFGIDQSFVQRYHTARSEREAQRSVWLAAWLYVPLSLLFFAIGTALFAYYSVHPGLLSEVESEVAAQRSIPVSELTAAHVGDRVLPHFIVQGLPPGVTGLLVAAIFAAAMSSVDTSLNSSATVLLSDVYKTYLRPRAGERESMRVLHLGTLAMGVAGTGIAWAMIGVKSILDAWWTLQGIFAGGLLGLFLLGMIGRRARRPAAVMAVLVGIACILWMTLSPRLPDELHYLRNPLHSNMIIVVGTLTIFLVGMAWSRWSTWRSRRETGGGDERSPVLPT